MDKIDKFFHDRETHDIRCPCKDYKSPTADYCSGCVFWKEGTNGEGSCMRNKPSMTVKEYIDNIYPTCWEQIQICKRKEIAYLIFENETLFFGSKDEVPVELYDYIIKCVKSKWYKIKIFVRDEKKEENYEL